MARRKPTSDLATATGRFAVRHGLTSDAPVIPGESLDGWVAHRDAIVEDLAPVGAFEAALAEKIAVLLWESRRVSRYEREALLVALDNVEAGYARRTLEYPGQPRSVAEAEQRLDDAQRCLHIIEHVLELPPETPLAAIDAEAIFIALANEADAEVDELLEGIAEAADGGTWTYGRLVAVLEAICARDEEAFDEALVAAVALARRIAQGWQLELAKVEADIDRGRRASNIPAGPVFESILRYGGAKNRQLYQAINQLEATQSRRAGAPIPLARVQLFGLPGS